MQKALLLVFLGLIAFIVLELVLVFVLPGSSKKQTVKTVATDFTYENSTSPIPPNYNQQGQDSITFLGFLKRVFQDGSGTHADILLYDGSGNSTKYTLLLLTKNDPLPFALLTQHVPKLNAGPNVSFNRYTETTAPGLNTLSGKPLIFLMETSLPSQPENTRVQQAVDELRSYMPCNRELANQIQSGREGGLSCVALVKQADVYVP